MPTTFAKGYLAPHRKESSRYLFALCCVLSALFHGGLLYFLYLNPPLIRVVATKLFPSTSSHPTVSAEASALAEIDEKNEALDEAIAQTYFIRKNNPLAEEGDSSLVATPQALEQSPSSLLKELLLEEESPLVIELEPLASSWGEEKEEEGFDQSETEGLPTVLSLLSQGRPISYEIGLSEQTFLEEAEKKDAEILSREEDPESNKSYELFPPSHELGMGTDFSFSTKALAKRAIAETKKVQNPYELKEKRELEQEELFEPSALEDLNRYALPEVETKNWNQQFDSQILTFSDEEGALYFSIDLKPTPSFQQAPLSSSYVFVIDLTSSNAKKEFAQHRQALLKSLKQLGKGDLFTIALIGKKTSFFSNEVVPFSQKTLLDVEDFLKKKIQFGGKEKDFLTGLNHTIETLFKPQTSLNNLLLLTAPYEKQLNSQEIDLVRKIIKTARGKASLFPVHLQSAGEHPLYEALSLTTGGKILAYPTLASYSRKLAALLLDIRSAILKDLFIDAVADDGKTTITLAPLSDNFTKIYERKPLKIVGKMDKPGAFTLKIRGLNGDELVTIEKKICFTASRRNSKNVKELFEASLRMAEFNDFALGRKLIPDKLSLKGKVK